MAVCTNSPLLASNAIFLTKLSVTKINARKLSTLLLHIMLISRLHLSLNYHCKMQRE